MTKAEYSRIIGALRISTHKALNNAYIWCSIAVQSLENSLTDPAFVNAARYTVPSAKKVKSVTREPEKIREVISCAIDRDLYSSVFVYLVAQVEAYLNDIILTALKFDNRRLKTRIQGVDHTRKIDVDEIIDAKTKEALIETIIEKELQSLFYAGPPQQFEYLKRVIGIDLVQKIREEWIEIKATRDLLVHNSGVINRIYIDKVGEVSRGEVGEKIAVNKQYFEGSVVVMKSLIGKSASILQKSAKANL